MFGLQWYDILLVVIVFLLFLLLFAKYRKMQKTDALTTATAVRLKTAQAKILQKNKKK